jgi:predicted RecA/RadA family phage recombinase
MAIEEVGGLGDLLKYEADKNYCREIVTVAAGQNLKSGSVVGIKTATDEVTSVYLPTGEENEDLDGSETAIGVLLEDVDATSGAKKSLMIARDAILANGAVIFPADATDLQKKKIKKDLEARGLVIRQSV